jgi:enoyl-[acyl-carrier-protein] reductase (NADH)
MALHLLPRLSIICSVLQGFGWAIAKALAEAGAEISLGVWVGTQQLELLQPANASTHC